MNAHAQKTVAVVGARGIGRHHAKWWHIEGAEVCAIVGTSDASNRATVEKLRGMFDFAGAPYTDLAAMLSAESPDVVDVCSPNVFHREHVERALEAGCDVLCEKPFVYDAAREDDALLASARGLVDRARAAGRLLGMCAQYAAGAVTCLELLGKRAGDPVSSVGATIKSPERDRPQFSAETWIDLGPHLVSVVHALVPGARLGWDGATCETSRHDAIVKLVATGGDGREHACELTAGRTAGPPANVRRIRIDDTRFDIEGGKDADGNFCAMISHDGTTSERIDAMRLTIREFLRGTAVVDGATAVANLEAVLAGRRLIEKA